MGLVGLKPTKGYGFSEFETEDEDGHANGFETKDEEGYGFLLNQDGDADDSDLKPTVTTSPPPPPSSGTSYSSESPFVEAGRWKREREEDDGDKEPRGPVTKLCTAEFFNLLGGWRN
jgi:hypothetical protein